MKIPELSIHPGLTASCILILTAGTSLVSADAASIYQNKFDDPESLNGFTVYGEEFTGYSPPPLHTVSIDAGQLRIDSTSLHPNGPNTIPHLMGRAYLSLDAATAFAPGYTTTLSQNSGLISWSFNISNRDGAYNNYFACVLAGTQSYPYDGDQGFARGYAFCGGGMVGSRMYIKRFDYGMDGGGSIMIDVTDGLGTLPEKGSFRITFDPATSTWSLYGETGPEYTDPAQVDTLLGTAVDDVYTNVETGYFGLLSKTTGTTFFDNVRIEAVPEPSSVVFMAATLVTAGFVRKTFAA